MPQNLISAITAKKMLSRGCKGYLVVVRDIKVDMVVVEKVPVLCEFPDIIFEDLPGLPPDRGDRWNY